MRVYILLAHVILQIVIAIAAITNGLAILAKLDELAYHTTTTDINQLEDIRNLIEKILVYLHNYNSYHL